MGKGTLKKWQKDVQKIKELLRPSHVMNAYGADALQLYLINSPVVILLKKDKGIDFVFCPIVSSSSIRSNIMDQWLLANCQSLLKIPTDYILSSPQLLQLIENLTNWYICFNRKRLKGMGENKEDRLQALTTLYEALFVLVCALAPFIPYLTNHLWSLLTPYLPPGLAESYGDLRSVHYFLYPEVNEGLFDDNIKRKVGRMQNVIELACSTQEKSNIGLKTPLPTLVIIADPLYIDDICSLEMYIHGKLNVRNTIFTLDEEKFNICSPALVDWQTLGKRLKRDVQKLKEYLQHKSLTIDNIYLEEGDLTITRVVDETSGDTDSIKWESKSDNNVVVLLNPSLHPELVNEGFVRELLSQLQQLRKKAGLIAADDARMEYCVCKNGGNIDISVLLTDHQAMFSSAIHGEPTQFDWTTTPADNE
ncbi:hypothetical protein AJ80_09186 [Polytolypa hystricis UAMH7299]|uniref:Methionyl/Valyl/Leucyl/Isoleucyl-tRNA synthetase anticodon-binding domain-containing protein n=1 Tax=Polytolypa hystricis (strain UAMH7299) TaxID=1447883 RepID=A0A2B7WUZ7_POLH7|nr:hypothetical protein AJ80_09186 [Polytolypa hystricis UAMH7299]